MGYLLGLSGTDGRPRDAMWFKGHTTLRMWILKNGKEKRAYIAAGGKGAINIWIDDDGFYRVERMVNHVTRDSRKFKKFTDVTTWAKAALKLIK